MQTRREFSELLLQVLAPQAVPTRGAILTLTRLDGSDLMAQI
jgi:hypothetical protein